MDIKVSRKETRLQPSGLVMELVSDIFDVYPVYGNRFSANIITDIEILDDPLQEQLDRAMFAVVKQRGADPLDKEDGIQWAENVIGEVPSAVILLQIQNAVYAEGPGVKVLPEITPEGTAFKVSLTKPRAGGII